MLRGKTAVVTGSTSGIGLGIANSLAAEGTNIMLNGFGEYESTKAEIAALGVKVGYHGADMSKPAEVADLIATTERVFGACDIVVNNAGIQHVANIEDFPIEKWDAVIAINLSSAFHATRAALPGMKKRNWGRFVNIASAHGLVASAQKSAYVAAKHGIIGFTKVTSLETAHTGITANAICPGWVLTPLVQKQIEARAQNEGKTVEAAKKELLLEKQPSGEFVTPEQLGAMAVFLCSDAAAQIKGASFVMDGGWTAQ
ncbi:MAG: 3-hydroxybutyrate dehydrogenase [Candidatus Protistobacter heckmanni]|nr:3-hydroxybutyrate dehydrogenase [Candidatus Protistobacter heckmanni]